MIRRIHLLLLAVVCVAFVPLVGCEKQLFAPNESRSVYDRYQILHGRSRAANRLNEFGGEEPAVTERLRPLDTP